MKYFVFSIDDGTIYDRKVIEIFNKHHIQATFNLNSGLDDFVWYKDDKPVRRLSLKDNVDLYKGHEVASHSLTHPHITMCPDDAIYREVKGDIDNLESTFNRKVTTFAFPFHDFDDRCINFIKDNCGITTIRVSELDRSFEYPIDQYHFKITSMDICDALNIIDDFINGDGKLFVFVSHAYDFEFNSTYNELEKLCQIVSTNKDIKILTMGELSRKIF